MTVVITTVRLPRNLLDDLGNLAARDGVPRSQVIERALAEFCRARLGSGGVTPCPCHRCAPRPYVWEDEDDEGYVLSSPQPRWEPKPVRSRLYVGFWALIFFAVPVAILSLLDVLLGSPG